MACADRVRLRAVSSIAASLLAGGCAAPAVEPWFSSAPPVVLVAAQDAGVRDLRATYRSAACRLLPEGTPCDNVLLRLPGEGDAPAGAPPTNLAQRYRIVFVPGLFSECFDRYARPFSDVQAALVSEGFAAENFRLPGRGTSTANAARLAGHFAAVADDPRPIIVFAYSKGLPDTLEFVVRHRKGSVADRGDRQRRGRGERQPARRRPVRPLSPLGRRVSAPRLRTRFRR